MTKAKTETKTETTAPSAELKIPDRIDLLSYEPYAEAHEKLKAMRERLAEVDAELERLRWADPLDHEATRLAAETRAALTGRPAPEAQSIGDMLAKLERNRRAIYRAVGELELVERRKRQEADRELAEPFRAHHRALGAEMAHHFAGLYRVTRELARLESLFPEGGLRRFRRPPGLQPEKAWPYVEGFSESGLLVGDLRELMKRPGYRGGPLV